MYSLSFIQYCNTLLAQWKIWNILIHLLSLHDKSTFCPPVWGPTVLEYWGHRACSHAPLISFRQGQWRWTQQRRKRKKVIPLKKEGSWKTLLQLLRIFFVWTHVKSKQESQGETVQRVHCRIWKLIVISLANFRKPWLYMHFWIIFICKYFNMDDISREECSLPY